MPLVVEDGTGLSNANAYVSESFVDTFHADRNNTSWADATSPEKQAAIIRASEYIDKRFGRRFRGFRKLKEQALEWPRLSSFDDDGFLFSGTDDLPRQLEKAAAEYSLRAFLCGVLAPDPIPPVPKQSLESGETDRTDEAGTVITGEVTRKKERVGPIEEETWYETTSQVLGKNLAAGAKGIQSSLVNDFVIPEYPEADLWLEELLISSMSIRLARAD